MMPTLGLLEAFDRHSALLARTPITRWPVTVGRGLDCDLVLDDPFVAPTHLRIDRPVDAPRTVHVEVLETRNGAGLQGKHYGKGEGFDWPDGTPLDIGRTRITLRLADTAIADEQALPQFPWRRVAITAVLLALVAAVVLGSSWLEANDASKFLKSLPGLLLGMLLVLGIWSGVWAVANKVFDGHLQFWRHVRIACAAYLVAEAVQLATSLAAFAFSWEALSHFAYLLMVLVLAGGLYAHLAAVLPRRRAGLAWTVAAVVALGIPAWLGTQWLDRMRLSNTLYMSSLFPPSLRMAPAVPVPQFLQKARSLRGKLDRRLRDDGQAGDDE
ncbi:MAG: FHA domain-containing protein [Comamonadaceae bacterium]|nr:FHA domain-containing protein [Comamonadaceae bacterium]